MILLLRRFLSSMWLTLINNYTSLGLLIFSNLWRFFSFSASLDRVLKTVLEVVGINHIIKFLIKSILILIILIQAIVIVISVKDFYMLWVVLGRAASTGSRILIAKGLLGQLLSQVLLWWSDLRDWGCSLVLLSILERAFELSTSQTVVPHLFMTMTFLTRLSI